MTFACRAKRVTLLYLKVKIMFYNTCEDKKPLTENSKKEYNIFHFSG